MEKSEKFGFNLPNRDGDDIADINEITQNFRLIEEQVPSNDDLEEAKVEAIQEATKNLILNYIEYEITEENEVNILRCDPSIEGDYIIPEKIEGYPVTSICRNFSPTSQYGFLDCVNLNSIVIPDTVELIGSNAFNNCVSLEKVHIGNGVRKIDGSAFRGCSALKSVYLPNVETVGTGAFEACTNLEAVTVGKGLVVVGLFSFGETNLKDVYYEGSQDEWNDIVFESQNDIILNAKIHFNYDSTLTTKGYVDEALRNAVDQTYSPESPNAQSGIAVAEAVSGKADKWTTLLNTTLTEEQSGASEIWIEIPNWETLKAASRFKLLVNIVAQEDITAQTTQITIKNYGGGTYNAVLCWSAGGACGAGETLYYRGIFETFPQYTKASNGIEFKDCVGFYTIPYKYTSANSIGNAARVIDSLAVSFWDKMPPYLHITLASGGIIGTGSKIVMEVC